MKRYLKVLSILLVLILVLSPMVHASADNVISYESIKDLDLSDYTIILHTNDSHGRAVPDSYNGYMGFTAVSALKKLCEAAGAEVILLDAGDTLHGLPFATMNKGATIIKLMNLAGYDAMTPGNHDFNYGTDRLIDLSRTMNFKLLSANISWKESKDKVLDSSTIIEKDGVKYGIFGLSTPETAFKTNPNNVSKISFDNPVDAAKEEVEELKKDGAEVIIALSHLGIDESSEFTSKLVADKVEGIDLIVDGHSHSTLEAGLKVDDTLIVSTGDYTKNIGVVAIDSKGNMNAGLVNAKQFTETDKAIDDTVSQITVDQEKILSEIVGKTSVKLDGVREHVRTQETNLGNLVTDAMRDATGADVAFTNGGGIRASIEIGDITKKSLVTVFPFGNYVVTKKVTGKALLEALEVGVASYPEPLGAFPQVSGITFSIDINKPAGSRVIDAKIGGVPVDKKATYLLATNDFIVAGGDGYTMLANFAIANEYGALEEVLVDYIKKLGDVTIGNENRITVIEGSKEETKEESKEETSEETKEETSDSEDTVNNKANNDTTSDSNIKDNNDVSTDSRMDQPSDKSSDKDTKKSVEASKYTKSVKEYKVEKGDHLRKIAKELFGDANKWKLIYEWNKDNISDPNRIFTGQILIIYEI
jgi:5'-nucleotidase / UDP-sugar diphosphatase